MVRHLVTSSRNILASDRTPRADIKLGVALTFIAGAINAGGFMAVGQYTSHMSGIISAMADNLAVGSLGLVFAGLGALVPFLAGAGCSAILINWGRRHCQASQYALPLLVESALLLSFGLLGPLVRPPSGFVVSTVVLLCFVMGLQNATVTKISGARIRTTHVTGIVTDIGIELGKLVYWNRSTRYPDSPAVRADRDKIRLLSFLLGSFFLGGVVGGFAFQSLRSLALIPLAVILLGLTLPAFTENLTAFRSRRVGR